MVRSLPLAVLAAALAASLPAAAETSADLSPGSAASCSPADLAALCVRGAEEMTYTTRDPEAFATTGSGEGGDEGACAPWEINTPGTGEPISEVLVVDPDGCVRGILRRVVGWPPVEVRFLVLSSDSSSDPAFLLA